VGLVYLAQDRWWAVMNVGNKRLGSNFLNGLGTVTSSRRTLLHGVKQLVMSVTRMHARTFMQYSIPQQ